MLSSEKVMQTFRIPRELGDAPGSRKPRGRGWTSPRSSSEVLHGYVTDFGLPYAASASLERGPQGARAGPGPVPAASALPRAAWKSARRAPASTRPTRTGRDADDGLGHRGAPLGARHRVRLGAPRSAARSAARARSPTSTCAAPRAASRARAACSGSHSTCGSGTRRRCSHAAALQAWPGLVRLVLRERPARHPDHAVPRPRGRRARRPAVGARCRQSRSRSRADRDADGRAAAPPAFRRGGGRGGAAEPRHGRLPPLRRPATWSACSRRTSAASTSGSRSRDSAPSTWTATSRAAAPRAPPTRPSSKELGRPPQVAPARHPRRPLARARRRGHPDRVLARVRAAEARAHRRTSSRSSSPSSSRTAPRASRSSSRRPRAGARPSCARRADVGEGLTTVLLQGDEAEDPLPHRPDREPARSSSLLEYALEHAKGTGDALFRPWGNVRRDLADACERGEDRALLARTTSAAPSRAGRSRPACRSCPIAQAMGHKDTRMLERVYGRQTPEQLAALMARAMGLPSAHPRRRAVAAFVAATLESAGSGGPDGPRPTPTRATAAAPKSSEAQQTLQSGWALDVGRDGVPGPGIEPGTRGFSVPCSTI